LSQKARNPHRLRAFLMQWALLMSACLSRHARLWRGSTARGRTAPDPLCGHQHQAGLAQPHAPTSCSSKAGKSPAPQPKVWRGACRRMRSCSATWLARTTSPPS